MGNFGLHYAQYHQWHGVMYHTESSGFASLSDLWAELYYFSQFVCNEFLDLFRPDDASLYMGLLKVRNVLSA